MTGRVRYGAVFCAMACFAATQSWAIGIHVADAPDNDLSLTLAAIESAQTSIQLNIYELTSPAIADALLDRIHAGVRVEILEEGQPVGGLSAAAKGIQGQLVAAMRDASADDRMLEMTSKVRTSRRYRFDHAKYAVIDSARVLLGSENYSPTGNPESGATGNRGWEVLIDDADLAASLQDVFATDTDTSHGDVLDLRAGGRLHGRPVRPIAPPVASPGAELDATAVQLITSPDTSLSGITALIKGAQTSIDIEQMTFDSAWKGADSSPLYDAVLAAARRGVKVRVLLNDESVFDHTSDKSKHKNDPTVKAFNQAASDEGLDISAEIADIKAMGVDYIHNKGMLIDGSITLISSINWDENSVEHNREAAVAITGTDVNAYYSRLFESDWSNSSRHGIGQQGRPVIDPGTRPLPIASTTVGCAARVRVAAVFGQLATNVPATADFAPLSGRRLEAELVLQSGGQSCVYSSSDSRATASRLFLEIRRAQDGSRSALLEGYTPRTRRVFSVRAKGISASLTGEFAAKVYDGSGPGHELLGAAVLGLAAEQQQE
jgi:phosphatidylserine/phosphatidylglycerophosphate/cardiolipin synthase-like enzyme